MRDAKLWQGDEASKYFRIWVITNCFKLPLPPISSLSMHWSCSLFQLNYLHPIYSACTNTCALVNVMVVHIINIEGVANADINSQFSTYSHNGQSQITCVFEIVLVISKNQYIFVNPLFWVSMVKIIKDCSIS